jgi:hypothetical protein
VEVQAPIAPALDDNRQAAADARNHLAAIRESFGVLRDEDDSDFVPRGPDERSRYLDRMWQL